MEYTEPKKYSMKIEKLGMFYAGWGDRTAQYFTHETWSNVTWEDVCGIKSEYRQKNKKVLCADVFAPLYRVQVWEV